MLNKLKHTPFKGKLELRDYVIKTCGAVYYGLTGAGFLNACFGIPNHLIVINQSTVGILMFGMMLHSAYFTWMFTRHHYEMMERLKYGKKIHK